VKIDLRELDETSGRVTGEDRVEFVDAMGETAVLDCAVEASYNRTGDAVYFHVVASSQYDTLCHRCLDPVVCPLQAEFDVVVRRGIDRAALRDDEVAKGDFITLGTNEHEVSLNPFVYENLVVNIPMLILCREDCKGLCPQCGNNRNRGECRCEPAGDPRWDALRKARTPKEK
jgi:uncharacterized protein